MTAVTIMPLCCLQNANGQPFTSSSYTSHIRGLLQRLTGRAVTVNGLRSAFLTWALNRGDCDEQMKDSLAKALRHTRREAEETYDRRTAAERLNLALDLARGQAEEGLLPKTLEAPQDSEEPEEDDIRPGQFVAQVEPESTLQAPRILLGRVQTILENRTASLRIDRVLIRSHWTGRSGQRVWMHWCLSGSRVKKKKPQAYRLKETPRSIHKKVDDS